MTRASCWMKIVALYNMSHTHRLCDTVYDTYNYMCGLKANGLMGHWPTNL